MVTFSLSLRKPPEKFPLPSSCVSEKALGNSVGKKLQRLARVGFAIMDGVMCEGTIEA